MKKPKSFKTIFIIGILTLLPLFSACKVEDLFGPREEDQEGENISGSELEDIWAKLVDPNLSDQQHVSLVRRLGTATGQDLENDEGLRIREQVMYTLLREAELTSFSGNEERSRVHISIEEEILKALGQQLRNTYRRNIKRLAGENSRYASLLQYQNHTHRLVQSVAQRSFEVEADETERTHIQRLQNIAKEILTALRDIEQQQGGSTPNSNGSGNSGNSDSSRNRDEDTNTSDQENSNRDRSSEQQE